MVLLPSQSYNTAWGVVYLCIFYPRFTKALLFLYFDCGKMVMRCLRFWQAERYKMKRVTQISRIGILMVLLIAASAGSVQSGRLALAQATAQETVISLSGDRIYYAGLATADFNGDGYKEIVAGGRDGMLYVVSTNNGTDWSTVWSHHTRQ